MGLEQKPENGWWRQAVIVIRDRVISVYDKNNVQYFILSEDIVNLCPKYETFEIASAELASRQLSKKEII